MNDKHIKQSPMLTLPGLGGGSNSPLVRKASSAPHDPGTPGTLSIVRHAPISHGIPFTGGQANMCTYAEFQSAGSVVLCQNLWGEWKYNLSSSYNLGTASYQNGSARYWTIGQYRSNSMSSYRKYSGRVMRFDYNSDKAYYYDARGNTKIVEDLDVYTQTAPTVTSSSTSFSGGSDYSNCSSYVNSNGLHILTVYNGGSSNRKMWIRNYTNNTTSNVSSYSELNFSSVSNIQTIFNAALSKNGTTISIWYRTTSSSYQVAKWSLSTPFDLTTAGSVSYPGTGNYSTLINQSGYTFLNANWGNRALVLDMYGALKSYSFSTDGDLSTVTLNGSINRSNNGGYLNGSSYGIWFDDGKKIIDQGYSSSHYVYDSSSNPYGWKFHDMNRPNRSSNYTSIYTWNSKEGQTFSDGRFNSNKSKLYSSYYSSTYRVSERNLSTPGDITTLQGSYSGANSNATFTGYTGGYSTSMAWYDKLNNKFHLTDSGNVSSSNYPSYFIFDLNSSGEFTGTYNSSPTGYTSGDFSGLNMLQPLSHNGKYFCYHNSGKCYIIFLDYAFEPAKGITALSNFTPEYNLPNGTQISTQWWNRMYVSSGRIFFAHYHGNSPLNMVYDITIDGVAPDDIT